MSLAKIPPTAKQKSILMMHIVVFIVVNAIIWVMWYNKAKGQSGFVYPTGIWITSAWFLSLIGHWAALYTRFDDKGMDQYLHDCAN